jgi:hypothetical protein
MLITDHEAGHRGFAVTETPPRNDAAMADILASIKRIVAEEDRRSNNQVPAFLDGSDDVFELTPDMRVDADDLERDNALATEAAEAATPSIDEAAVADIARIVVREELNGPLGVAMTKNIKKMIREEVQRALTDRA